MKEEEHFHSIRVISTLRGKKAYCIQPRCAFSCPVEQLHRKLLECEKCFDHFLFDYDSYDLTSKETKILCWKCQDSKVESIGMTLEQEQLLLAREVKQYNLSVVEELEKEYERKKSQLKAHERALNVLEKELATKAEKLSLLEEVLRIRKKRILELVHLHNVKKRIVVVKTPKAPKESKEPQGKTAEEIEEERKTEELRNVIFQALTNSIGATQGNEGESATDNGGI